MGNNGACVPNSSLENFVVNRSVPIHGITRLGLMSHPTGSSTLESPTTTLSLIRSDEPVYTTMSFRPFSPCHPTQAMAGPIVSHIRNPYPTFPGGVHNFLKPGPLASIQGWDATWGILRLRVFGPVQNASSTSVYWSSWQ